MDGHIRFFFCPVCLQIAYLTSIQFLFTVHHISCQKCIRHFVETATFYQGIWNMIFFFLSQPHAIYNDETKEEDVNTSVNLSREVLESWNGGDTCCVRMDK